MRNNKKHVKGKDWKQGPSEFQKRFRFKKSKITLAGLAEIIQDKRSVPIDKNDGLVTYKKDIHERVKADILRTVNDQNGELFSKIEGFGANLAVSSHL